MKTIKLFTASLALLSSLLFVGCDALADLGIDVDTNTVVDIPVELVKSDMQSCDFSVSLDDIDDLKQYLGKPKDLTIEDIELSVDNYKGDEFNGDLALKIDDALLWETKNINLLSIEGLSLKSDTNLNEDTLDQLGEILLNDGVAKCCFAVETSNQSAITASFTVKCKLIINVTVNPLN